MAFTKKQIIVFSVVAILLSAIVYLFVTDKFSTGVNPTERQIGAKSTNIDPVTGKVQQKSVSIEDFLSEIKDQLDSGFQDNYAKISKAEIVTISDTAGKNLLKDNFYLVRFDVGPTDDGEKIGEFFKMMMEKRSRESGNIDVESAMKKFKESKNYDAIVAQIKTNLEATYGGIMSKGFYMVVEDRNGVYIVNRVGDYLAENYRGSLRTEDQDGLLVFRLLVDFMNYGRLYKANDSEVQTVLGITNGTLKRENVLKNLVDNAKKNPSFVDFASFLDVMSQKYQ